MNDSGRSSGQKSHDEIGSRKVLSIFGVIILSGLSVRMMRNLKMSTRLRAIGALCGAALLTLGACKRPGETLGPIEVADPDDAEIFPIPNPLNLLSVAPVQGNWLVTTNPPDSLRTGVLPHIVSGGVGGHISGNEYWWNVLESGEISFDEDERFRLQLRYSTFARGEWLPECEGAAEGEYEVREGRLVLRRGDVETLGSVVADSNLVSVESLLVDGCSGWNLKWRMRDARFGLSAS